MIGDLARQDEYGLEEDPWARAVRAAQGIQDAPPPLPQQGPPERGPYAGFGDIGRRGWMGTIADVGNRMGDIAHGATEFVRVPAAQMRENPYQPGSEPWQFYENYKADQAANFGASNAFSEVFWPRWGQRGIVTSGAGSRIIQPQAENPRAKIGGNMPPEEFALRPEDVATGAPPAAAATAARTRITVRPKVEAAPGVTANPSPEIGALASPAGAAELAPYLDPTMARQIQAATRTKGGSTTNINTGENPVTGLMMGLFRNDDPRAFNTPGRLKQTDLENFVGTNRDALRLAGRSDLVGPRVPGDRYLGTWRDPESGIAYVDVSQRFEPDQIRKATKFGERTGQLAGWDVAAKAPIPVGNWPDYIQSPEFHQRMHEMASAGQNYLGQHPTREWWTNEPFTRVYGDQMMPHVAGYTAATAPNAAPLENLQTMSEYVRRHIAGEPILQPDWRVPEGMMTRSSGAQIGMEQSRMLNLDRAFRGATDELSRQKVREEARALLGDEGAVVLDRHWARLAENPARGVYANAQEGVVSSAPRKGPTDYDLLKAQVVNAAQTAGRTPKDFSADVWTGIRDTIQRTSDLYGQKFRGSAITGESKSYADHFEDIIRDKAQHLGISVEEMEHRLRTGDANLMSWFVATTPAAWAAYQQYQARTSSSSSDKDQRLSPVPQTAPAEL